MIGEVVNPALDAATCAPAALTITWYLISVAGVNETSTPVTRLNTDEITGLSGGAAETGVFDSEAKASANKIVALSLRLAIFTQILHSASQIKLNRATSFCACGSIH